MTQPEAKSARERAKEVVEAIRPPYVSSQEREDRITAAIEGAVKQELEECAKILDEWVKTYLNLSIDSSTEEIAASNRYRAYGLQTAADAIRSRAKEDK